MTIPKITNREEEVLHEICNGGSVNSKELADKLFISRTTVKTHIDRLYNKFKVNSIAKLIYKYYNYDLDYIVEDNRGRPNGSRKRIKSIEVFT